MKNNSVPLLKELLRFRIASGFTLIELLVALSAIVILGAVLMPNFSRVMDKSGLRYTADQIKTLVKVAQAKATNDPTTHYGVYLYPGTGTSASFKGKEMAVFVDSIANNKYDAGERILGGFRSLPKNVSMTIPTVANGGITNNAIVFRGDGTAKFGGKIILKSIRSRYDTISVLPSTGRVKMAMQ